MKSDLKRLGTQHYKRTSINIVLFMILSCGWALQPIIALDAWAAAAGTKLWESLPTGGGVNSSPAVSGGKVYVGSADWYLYAFDAATGSKVWSYKTGVAVNSSPAVSGGRVYVMSDKLYSLDSQTGAWLWEYPVSGDTSPVVAGGKVYVHGYNNTIGYVLYCLDAQTGGKVWEYQTGGSTSSPVVSGGKVYVGGDKVYCLDAATGNKVWESTVAGDVTPAVSGGKVYVVNDKVYCLDAVTGATLWTSLRTGFGTNTPTVAAVTISGLTGGKLYLKNNDNKLYCLDGQTGSELWVWVPASNSASTALVAVGGKIYFGSYSILYCLDGQSGNKVWEAALAGGWFSSSPAVVGGKVYAGNGDYKLYSIDAGDPNADGWPMYLHDLGHSGDGNLAAAADALFIQTPGVFFQTSPATAYPLKAFLGYTDLSTTDVTGSVASWTVADTATATISTTGVFTPAAIGQTTITATYTLNSKTYTTTKKIAVLPPGSSLAGGADFTSAASLSYNTALRDNLPDATTTRYYKLAPGSWKEVMVRFQSDTAAGDYRITLYDQDQTLLTSFNSHDGIGFNELVTFSAIPATLYVKVESLGSFDAAGSYSLTLEGKATAAAGTKVWESLPTGGGVNSSPAVSGGKVYVGSADWYLYAFDAATGSKIWSYKTGAAVNSAPAVSGGRVYVLSDKLYSLDSQTGAWLWEYPVSGDSSPVVAGGKVYVRSYTSSGYYVLYCLDGQTGNKLWQYQTNGSTSSPVVSGGKVYVGGDKIYSLDAASGSKIWESAVAGDVTPAVSGGKVYVVNDKVYCLDALTGATLWTSQRTGFSTNTPTVAAATISGLAGAKLYLKNNDNKLYCLDGQTGNELWAWVPTSNSVGTGLVAAGGKIYFGSYGVIYCLDGQSGNKVWEAALGGGWFYSSPAVVGGKVYAGNNDYKLYSIDAGDPNADGWPMYLHDLGHSGDGNLAAAADALFIQTPGVFFQTSPATAYPLKAFLGYTDLSATDVTGSVASWTVADTATATISAAGVLTPAAIGQTTVTATYTLNSKTYTTTRKITVLSPGSSLTGGADFTSAASLSYSTALRDNLPDAATVRYYKLAPGTWKEVMVRFQSATAAGDYRITLYDQDQTRLTSFNSYDGIGFNELVTFSAIPAMLYVKVESLGSFDAAGSYSLTLEGKATAAAGTKVWESLPTGGGVNSSPAVSGGKVYVGSADWYLYAFDAATGTKVWSYKTGVAVNSAPAVSGGRVYVLSDKLYSLDSQTGAWLWEYPVSGDSSPVVAGGKVYVRSYTSSGYYVLYCLDGQTGNKLWQYQTNGSTSSPVVSGGKVYVGGDKIYSLDAASGSKIWESAVAGDVTPAVSGGKVYVVNDKVYCLDALTGATLWTSQRTGFSTNTPTVAAATISGLAGAKLYLKNNDNKLYCLDGQTGNELWAWVPTSNSVGTGLVAVGGKIYFGSYGVIYCLDGQSGNKVWEAALGGGWFYSSPAVVGGKVYAGNNDYKLYSIDAGDPNADGWPMYLHDLGHSGDGNLAAAADALFIQTPGVFFQTSPATAYPLKAFLGYTDLSATDVMGSVASWTVADTAIATISAAGVLTPAAIGQTTVTATYTLNSKTYTTTKKITVLSPGSSLTGGADFTSAASLSYSTALRDNLPDAATARYYKLAPGTWKEVMVRFRSATAAGDYRITLYDQDQTRLTSFNSYDGIGFNELVTFSAIPATLYIKVESFGSFDAAGSYSLTLEGKATAAAGTKVWESLPTGGGVNSSPAVSGGKVYVGSADWYLYAFDAATGTKVWSYKTGVAVNSAPAVSGGRVYVLSDKLYSLDAQTGAWLWEYPVSGDSSPVVAGGKVYVRSYTSSGYYVLYCLDGQTGNKLWQYQTNGSTSSPVVSGGKVYVGGDKIYSLDAASGSKIWESAVAGDVTPAVSGGKVYVVNDKVYCLDALTGATLWTSQRTGFSTNTPTVATATISGLAGAKLYLKNNDNKLYCLDGQTGNELWAWVPTSNSVGTGLVAVGGKIYFGSYGVIYCLDGQSGNKVWEAALGGGWFYSSPAVVGGKVYAGNNDYKLYSIDAGDPNADGWPMYLHDLGHSGDGNLAATADALFIQTPGVFFQTSPATAYPLKAFLGYTDLSATDVTGSVASWTVADTATATISAAGVLTPAAIGQTTVTATYTLNSKTYTTTKKIAVLSPGSSLTGGADFTSAASLSYSAALRDNLPDAATARYYKLAPGSWKEVMVRFRSATAAGDYRITLYDQDQTQLTSFNSYDGIGFNELVTFSAIPAMLYVKVESLGSFDAAGSYSLTLEGKATAAAGTKVWESLPTGGGVNSSPAVSGGKVYVGSADWYLYAFDAATGSKIWSYKTGVAVNSSPAVSGGRVYVMSDKLYSLDAQTGAWLWEYPVSGDSSPVVAGGKVYVQGYNNTIGYVLYCLDGQTGNKLWQYQTNGSTSSPVVSGGKVYVGGDKVYCLDAANGSKIWESAVATNVTPAVSGGKVYVVNDKVYCLDALTGATLWTSQRAGFGIYTPTVAAAMIAGLAGGKVYVRNNDQRVYCLDNQTGNELWASIPDLSPRSDLTVVGGKIYFGGYGLYCLDAVSGNQIWQYTTNNWFYSAPAVVGGKVYAGNNNDYKLYSVDAGDPNADGWPMYRHDLQHTGDADYRNHQLQYGLIHVKPLTPFSRYELQLIEVYDDGDVPITSGVQFSVSNPNIATISGNVLTARLNGRVVIKADYNGAHYEQPLFVMVSADNSEGQDNETMAKAEILPPGEFWAGDMVSGSLQTTDTDYYAITLPSASLIEIGYLADGNVSDTAIELWDGADKLLGSTISLKGQSRILPLGLDAGTYYIKLTPAGDVDQSNYYYISYAVVASLSARQPMPIGLGETKSAIINSRSDMAEFPFSLSVAKNLEFLFVPRSLDADYQLEIADQDGSVIKQMNVGIGLPGVISLGLRAGTYTLRVKGNQYIDAEHSFSLSLQESSQSYEVEPNNTYQTATRLEKDISLSGMLDDDIDFYSFSLDVPRYIRINFNAATLGTAYKLTLYKGDDQSPIDYASPAPGTASAFIEAGLNAGDYYLKVEAVGTKETNASYSLSYTDAAATDLEIESNNTLLFANALDSTHPRRGRISYDADVDFYGFYVPATVTATINFSSESATGDYVVTLTNGAGTGISAKTSANGAAVSILKKLTPGNYYIKVEKNGDVDPLKFYHLSTTTASLAGLKSLVGIALTAPDGKVNVGNTLAVSATGNYSDATQTPLSSGIAWTSSDDQIAAVSQTGVVTGVATGNATIYAAFSGQAGKIDLTVGAAQQTTKQSRGNLILVAGGGINPADALTASTQYLSNLTYNRFLMRGFKKEDIYYFNPNKVQDIDGDGFTDNIVSEDKPTVAKLREVIENWAAKQPSTGPLHLILIDHGGIDQFEVSPGEIITAAQLDASLTAFENATGRAVVVYIEACKSGSLVNDLAKVGTRRMVITSTDDNNAYLQSDGRISFTQFFMDTLVGGSSFGQSYQKTKLNLARIGPPFSSMNPQLDDKTANALAATRLGGNFVIAGFVPDITAQTPDFAITATTTAQPFSATISDMSGTTKVWAVVTSPNYRPPAVVGDLQAAPVALPIFDMTDEVNGILDGVYNGSYGDFRYNGPYRIVFYARNADGLVTQSVPTVVTVSGGLPLDDVDITAPVTTASPVGGAYESAQSVTLTANEQTTIYYTTDGSAPTELSTVFNGPIAIAATTTLKYFAKDQAGNREAIKTQIYTIGIPGDVNGDKVVNLADAILVFQLLSKQTQAVQINKDADANGDGKIGLPETIYILQKVAGMR